MAITTTGRKSAFQSALEIRKIQGYILEEIDAMHKAAKALASTAGAKSANGQSSIQGRCGSQSEDVDHV
jgi:hypothetical protein